MPPAPFPRRALIEELEPRLLFSADFATAVVDALAPQAELRVIGADGEFTNTTDSQQQAQHASLEVVFIDLRVQDYEKILADIHEQNTDGRSIEIVMIDAERDGIAQIGGFLSQHHDIDAVHIISHGTDGSIQLGSASLNFDSLVKNATQIKNWGNALTTDADILLYGCDAAQQADGKALIDALARLTGADVAASEDLTGSAALGGDWALEYQTGSIEATIAIDAAGQAQWQGVLVNTAPTLNSTKSPALTAQNEDSGTPVGAVGTLVSQLVDFDSPAGQVDNVTDPDAGALLGIAVTAADTTSGSWFYSINNGTNWNALSVVTSSSARLLAADANTRLYFQPNANWSGTLANAITFHAWDQTSGSNGAMADTTVNGGASAFSTATDTASLVVNAVNDPPVAVNDAYSVNEDATLVVGPSTSNLANWWQMNDGGASQTVTDSGTLAQNATLGSSAAVESTDPAWTAGYVGSAGLSFDGSSDYVSTTSTFAKTASNFTLSAWFQTDTTTGQHHILWEGYSGGNGNGEPPGTTAQSEMNLSVGANDQDNKIVFFLGYDLPVNGADPIYIVSASDFTDTAQWHHAAVTVADLGGGVMQAWLYVDGVLEGTDTGVQNDRSAWGSMLIGKPDANTRYFDGKIDEVRVYDSPLSAAQVQAITKAGVLSNDTDPDNSLVKVNTSVVTGPANGTLSINSDGSFSYTANANFNGIDSFTYKANDGLADSNLATVTITVNPVNDAPSGTDKTVTTNEDTAYAFAAADFGLTDPVDAAGAGGANALLNVKIITLPVAGALTDNGVAVAAGQFISVADINSGKLVFTPAANANGAGYASFTFQVQDNGGTSNGGIDLDPTPNTLTVNVTAVNDAPAATNLNAAETYTEDTPLNLTGIVVSDVDSANVTVTLTLSAPAAGSLNTGTSGAVTSTYNAGTGVWTASGAIANVNTLLAGLIFTPAANFNSNFTIATSVSDGVAAPVTGNKAMTGTPVNDAPTASNLSAAETYTEDTPLNLTDIIVSDIDSANVTVILTLSAPAAGSLNTGTSGAVTSTYNAGTGVWTASGAIANVNTLLAGLTFTPALNYNSNFTIATSVSDGVAAPLSGSKTFTGTAVNDAPVITSNGGGASAAVSVQENSTAVTTVTSSDVDGGAPVYSILAGADGAKFTVNPVTGVLSFLTAPDYENPADVGADNVYNLTVQVADGNGGTDTQAIAVSVTNVADGIRVTPISVVPIGSETLVNTNTTDVQTINPNIAQAIATDANGNYVVVWTSNLQDGSLNGIYAQRYNAAGVAQGAEFRVNTATADNQINAAVAMDAAGNFVVTWSSNLQDGSGYGIYAQRYNAAGVAQGSEFLVNTTTAGGQSGPAIAMSTTGAFVITWTGGGQDPDASSGVYAQRFDASGVAQGGEFRVNTYTINTQQLTSAAMDAAGNFVITWASNLQDDGASYGVYAQRFNASGIAQGAEFRVNTTIVNSQLYNDVAVLPDGRFVVAYQSRNADNSYEVYLQRYAADGSTIGGETQVNATTISSAQQPIPSISADADGNIAVVWNSAADGSGVGVVGRRFDWSGTPLTGEFQVNTTSTGDQLYPEVVAQPGGRFIVAWGGNGSGDADGVFLQRYGLTTTEGGGTATFSVVLEKAPTADVVIPISVPDASEGTVSVGSLTFTTANWNIAQTVTVTGVQDYTNDGNVAYTAVLGIATSTDLNFNGLNPADLSVANLEVPNVAPVNSVPVAQTVNEDTSLVFSSANGNLISIGDGDAGSNALQVTLTGTNGTITLAGTSGLTFSTGDGSTDSVMTFTGTSANINTALNGLIFTPSANYHGAANLQILANDQGNTGTGGALTDTDTVSITITPVNDAPAGTSKTVAANEDTAYTFTAADFGFTDVSDSPANALLAVKITSLPGAGSLTDNGVAVAVGQFVSLADVTGGLLKFTPAANANGAGYASFTFQVQDNGGTANGGIDLDPTPNTITIDVTPVNDAPAGTDKTVTANEDTAYTFAASDFGFTDVSDSPANALLAVKITTLPAAGSLTDNGVAVAVGQFVSLADITGGLLKFTPAANANGAGYASFTFQVQDNGGTANGGVDLNQSPNTIMVDVTPLNDAPAATNLNAAETYTEDTPLNLTGIVVSDVDSANVTVTLTLSAPAAGSLNTGTSGAVTSTYNAGTGVWTASGAIANVNTLLAGLIFTPAANFNSNFTIATSVSDGVAAPVTGNKAMTGTAVNDAPTASNLSAAETYTEDTPLNLTDIIVSDIDSANVTVTLTLSAPAAGSLNTGTSGAVTSTYNAGTGVWTASGAIANVNTLLAGLTFTPALNYNSNFTIATSISDGVAAPVTGTKAMTGTAVNDAPAGTSKTVAANEDTAYTFTAADFGFTDVSDSPANALLAVKITSLPGAGSLTDNGVAVAVGQFVSLADVTGGLLKFTPAANANGAGYASFTFQVQDNGGTANGGIDLDPTPNTITIDVTPVNDAPAGTDKTVTANEDTAYTFAASDFGFTDVSDSPANALLAVKITTLPAAGSLTDNGVAVAVGQFVSLADITGGLLKFTPAANANGAGYASFTFQVQDNGGTANGGVDLNQSPNTIMVDVTPLNDAPAATNLNAAETYTEDTPLNLTGIVVSDVDSANVTVTLTLSAPAAGSLNTGTSGAVTSTYNAGTGVWTASGAIANVNTLLAGLIFTPAANFNSNFTIATSVSDGVAAPVTGNKAMTGTAVNDAPAGTDKTVTSNEDMAYTFTTADFGFADPIDAASAAGANALLAVKITSLPAAGSLTDNGVAIIVGQFVSLADIAGGLLKFTPAANANGNSYASFTFQVQDNGGTANGGVDLDQTPKTMTVNVTPVTDLNAQDDVFSVNEDTTLNDSVDTNDSTTSGGVLNYALASGAANGTVLVNADGSFSYTGNANFNGSDSFTYTVTDAASGDSDTRAVSLTITPVTDLTAQDDSFTVNEDTTLNADVSLNDSTTSGGVLTYVLAAAASNGTVLVNADGSFSYTGNANFNGTDSFTYTVTDAASGESSIQTVSLTVNPVTDLTAQDDSFTVNEDTTLNDSVATNDSTTSGGVLTYALAGAASNGTVLVNADGSFSYTGNANFNGTDSFTYTVTDAASGESDTRAVSLTITPVTDLTAQDDSFTVNEDTTLNDSVATNDSTTSGGALTFALASAAANGVAVVNADGSFSYTGNANFNGSDSFTYTVTDAASGGSSIQTVSLTVNPVTDLTTQDDSFTVNEDTLLNGDVSLNDGTTSGGVLSFALASAAVNGVAVVNADGSFSYTGNANFNGSDSFTYTVTDAASGESDTRTVNLTIDQVNDAPVITANTLSITEGATVVLGNTNLNASDIEQGPSQLTYTVSNITHGQFEWAAMPGMAITGFTQDNIDSGLVAFVHDASDFAPAYDVTVSDGSLTQGPQSATINFTAVDEGINVTPASGPSTTEAGGTVTFGVTLNSQPFDDVTIFIVSSNAAEGTASVSSLTFTSSNWNTAQQVTLTGVDDFVDDGDQAYGIQLQPATSADRNYNALDANDIALTNLDDDTAGIAVNPTVGLTTGESGASDTFSVVLTSRPLANVVIGLGSSNPAEGVLSASSLTFTQGNWNIPQIVTVTGVDDSLSDGDITYQAIAAPASSTDPLYNGLAASAVDVTNLDVVDPVAISPDPAPEPVTPPVDEPAPPEEKAPSTVTAKTIQPIEPSVLGIENNQGDFVEETVSADRKSHAALLFNNDTKHRELLTDPVTHGDALLRLLEIIQVDHLMGDSGHNSVSHAIHVEIAQDEDFNVAVLLKGAQITAVSLSVGAVWWALRAGGLFTSLLTSLPAWRSFDVLPVLGREKDEEEEDESWNFGDEPEEEGEPDDKRTKGVTT